ncbi:threonyl alanyl tRNA synthetase SAD, putative [Babesia ovata]|uniref:Threonyl alanyl tRNA synthetase SAD, putative n=1 Tax=Babesia ovata TaxID=189622 RepID=A0A2H6K8I4_9APIC|nr:threonyl alanyl tRNA synthetase SAD, putative [Babesia ovata]GBE59303.1 threonyl alanyl tRNA synthetase SAD, putative [Babesia ovata]
MPAFGQDVLQLELRLHWHQRVAKEAEVSHKVGQRVLGGLLLLCEHCHVGLLAGVLLTGAEVVGLEPGHALQLALLPASLSDGELFEALVLQVRQPLPRRQVWEVPEIVASAQQEVRHVLEELLAVDVVVLPGGEVVHVLVQHGRVSTLVELDHSGVPAGLVGLDHGRRLWVGRVTRLRVHAVLLHEGLPVLVALEPLRNYDEHEAKHVLTSLVSTFHTGGLFCDSHNALEPSATILFTARVACLQF